MSIISESKQLGMRHNVSFKVIDPITNTVVSYHKGHNHVTNSMLTGIGHYLMGDGVLNQGHAMLSDFVPRYISLGTMGLLSQEEDGYGLPDGIDRKNYAAQRPGYGSDGYDEFLTNDRNCFGLGPKFDPDSVDDVVGCELISDTFLRSEITFREMLPETQAELGQTIDVVYSATISLGALSPFRNGKDHIFITEAGLWSNRNYIDASIENECGDNGLLAAYRIMPPDSNNHNIADNDDDFNILRQNIIKVKKNQVLQVVWKIQLGSIYQFNGYDKPPENSESGDTVYTGPVWTAF